MTEPSASRSLEDWLAWQATAHPRGIDMGLERIRKVWQRLGSPLPAPMVISVGGTNGKGSTVAFLEAMLRAGGLRVGTFTSPHLLRYNERVRIDGLDADDASLVQAFERIEEARGDISLTYFEFGALAAILLFARREVDVAVLEVGLGGRLDAVNLIDADVAIVTTVDLDHQDWLGNDRKASRAKRQASSGRDGLPSLATTIRHRPCWTSPRSWVHSCNAQGVISAPKRPPPDGDGQAAVKRWNCHFQPWKRHARSAMPLPLFQHCMP